MRNQDAKKARHDRERQRVDTHRATRFMRQVLVHADARRDADKSGILIAPGGIEAPEHEDRSTGKKEKPRDTQQEGKIKRHGFTSRSGRAGMQSGHINQHEKREGPTVFERLAWDGSQSFNFLRQSRQERLDQEPPCPVPVEQADYASKLHETLKADTMPVAKVRKTGQK